jgi:lipoate-protein ligase A
MERLSSKMMDDICKDVLTIDEAFRAKRSVMIDYSFTDPIDNLCYDDTLLALAESGNHQASLRFWESTAPFIVLGRSGDPARDLHLEAVRNTGVKVYRRSSGGGTVVQGPGCLNYSMILPKAGRWQDVRTSYCEISTWLLAVLRELGVDGEYKPISDLAICGRKFSGNAQRRGRNYILQHGTLLYDFDLDQISAWLAQPEDQPPYRENRTHAAFVTNINFHPNDLKQKFAAVFLGEVHHDPLPGSMEVLKKQRRFGRVQELDISEYS